MTVEIIEKIKELNKKIIKDSVVTTKDLSVDGGITEVSEKNLVTLSLNVLKDDPTLLIEWDSYMAYTMALSEITSISDDTIRTKNIEITFQLIPSQYVYVVTQYRHDSGDTDIIAVYKNEEQAEKVCKDSELDGQGAYLYTYYKLKLID